MGLLDSMNNIPDPTMAKRRPFDQGNYSTMAGSGLYAALNQGNAAQNQNVANSGQHLAQQYGTVQADPRAGQQYAMTQQLGALQPADIQNQMHQFGQENQNAQMQDAWSRQAYDTARQQQGINNQFYGNIIGQGLGAGLGYLSDKQTSSQFGKKQAKNQRANMPYGPINNQYSQGF